MATRSLARILLCLLPAPAFSSGLGYSTYLRDGFQPAAVATDSSGNVYLAGTVNVDSATSQTAAMVVKLNPQGAAYVYVRTLGGSSSDSASAIAVDSAGNAYVTGTAASPDFPVTPGRQLGSPSSGPGDARTFLAKFDPQGSVLFSELLGASSYNFGQAVALTPQGEIVVSGFANPGFPVTAGAYTQSGKNPRPYLMKLDATGATVRFAAFGIGGSALSVDAAGNIYMAGSTALLDYPTTPGVYQPVFHFVVVCTGLCFFGYPGTNQYVTKVDATGSTLLYSTAVEGESQTTNAGLAVDAAGGVYLTGLAYGEYPYTVTDPGNPQVRPFLTSLDPAGQKVLYSIPIGGAGIALDASGHVLVGGSYNNLNTDVLLYPSPGLPPPPAASQLAVPQCLLNHTATTSQAYVTRIDAATGNIQATVLIDGSDAGAAGISLNGNSVWIAGNTAQPDVPISPGAVVPPILKAGPLPGAFLAMADFSLAAPAGTPQLECVLDSAGLSRNGAVAPNELISLFGANLGPAQAVAASDALTTSLAGVTVTFDGTPATLLYVSQSQINLAVPVPTDGNLLETIEVTINGLSSPPREIPIVATVPNLFAVAAPSNVSCAGSTAAIPAGALVPMAQNQDGTPNSCDHPAKAGSVVSFFVDGLGGQLLPSGQFIPAYSPAVPLLARVGNWSAEVVNIDEISSFVFRIDVLVPPDVVTVAETLAYIDFTLDTSAGQVPVGPRGVSPSSLAGAPLASAFWVSP